MARCSEQRLSPARLREVFHYDAEIGVFFWRASGKKAGTEDRRYAYLNVDGARVLLHRAAWAFETGAWPRYQIDHRDGVKKNNRFANLRDATASVNQQNQRVAQRHNSTGFLGVVPVRLRFRAQIWRDGAAKNLGTYDTPEEAYAAYVKAKRVVHLGCTL